LKGKIENVKDTSIYDIQKGQGVIGKSAALNKAILINDTSLETLYRNVDGINRLSEICVPISIGDKQFGMLNAEASSRNFFTPWHQQILNTIATLIGDKIISIEANKALQAKQIELASASNKIAEVELSMLRSQMNPHFIFNSLHSIHNYIWDNKQEDAAEYLIKFAKLIRRILEFSAENSISLLDEIENLKLYIALEHRRTNAKFSYTINTENIIGKYRNLKVPPLIYQPFIENAIWHGLNNLADNSGELQITFSIEKENLYCQIQDNGIGREAASKLKSKQNNANKSMGISITQKRIDQFSKNDKNALVYNDLPIGTIVKIKLPLIYE
jgi:LytS/YehU family sensor histidine kinase